MDKTRKLRRQLGYQVAKLHGLQESVDLTLDDASTKALALQVREQAGICLDLLDKYQSSVPGRMWLDAEKRCRPLREDLRRTEKLFRSNSGEWEGRILTQSDIRRVCDWTWDDVREPAYQVYDPERTDSLEEAQPGALLAPPRDAVATNDLVVPDACGFLVDDDDEFEGVSAVPLLRFTLPMDEESRGHVLVVLVPCETGLVYEHRYGGSSGRLIEVEGFLVPASADPEHKAVLEQYFLSDLGKTDVDDPDHADAFGAVKEAVRHIRYQGSGDRLAPLELNETRLGELDEAWVPVLTPDGPGYLAWINAD